MGAMQRRIHLGGPARIHFIQSLRYSIPLPPAQELRNRRGVQSTSRNPEAAGRDFRLTEKVVGYGDGSLHTRSITRVTPDPLIQPQWAVLSPCRPVLPGGPRRLSGKSPKTAGYETGACATRPANWSKVRIS